MEGMLMYITEFSFVTYYVILLLSLCRQLRSQEQDEMALSNWKENVTISLSSESFVDGDDEEAELLGSRLMHTLIVGTLMHMAPCFNEMW